MIFFASALMHVGVWACVTIAAIHFDSIAVMWLAIIGSCVLPSFSSTRNDDSKNSKSPLNLSK